MADRLFSGVLLLIAIGYTFIAFTVIKAPFQYDPLGPESWPRILGVVAIACLVPLALRPEVDRLGIAGPTWLRLGALVIMLSLYAWLYEPLGFILSTFLFCAGLSLMLGSKLFSALLFSAVTSIVGYFLCTGPLELNLPAGILNSIL
ncbi:MAG TPA: tripartite tricarboxylate transporter TctB family protein [Aurantimonas sp.]|uniref:Tripartite tricarboxylate transporter TctB family protein n=1 Tax=Aurantimonas marianensis TaxID=2920428 RepID=A0A9X2KG46_9HYPH|nr:tripartite tricarboxylate transporter TctB family protein [Aurantimonas marianensis]MCP3055885.1 tripartite tricarboxylate transporter TctB family protein [Aurantimonas marianensis]